MLRPTSLVPVLALAAAAAQAQDTAVAPKMQVVSVQPLPALFSVLSAEYERVVAPAVTLGLGATAWSPRELSYGSIELKARYYPGPTPLAGISIGGSVGLARVEERLSDSRLSVSGAAVGALLEYGWLLGSRRALHAGVGVGAKAVLVRVHEFVGNVPINYPTLRMSVGYAF